MTTLKTLIAKTPKTETNIRSKVVRITPEFARGALESLNNSNRPMSKGLAKLYANEMLRGKWRCNGEPLIFSEEMDTTEHLISGQHRLMGLVLAQQAIELGEIWPDAQLEWDTVVVQGVDHSTADTVDTGKNRSHADVLFRDSWIDEVIPAEWNESVSKRRAWTKCLAGAARLVWLIEGGAIVSSAPKFIISEMMEFLQRHRDLSQFVTMVLDANDGDGGNGGLKMSLPYIAALSYACCVEEIVTDEDGIDVKVLDVNADLKDSVDVFLNHVAVGTGFDKGSPEWALTAYWNQLVAEKGTKDRDREWVGPFIKAVKHYLAGNSNLKVSDVKLTKKEFDGYADFPVMFDGWHTLCFERSAAKKAARAAVTTEGTEAVSPESDETTGEDGVPAKAVRRKRKTADA